MSARTDPLVTVVVCVYNAGEYLRPALQSVINQSYRNLEILIVNDGSTDGCMERIADLNDPRIRIIHQENRGKPTAMNVALDQMRGEFYVVNDADDVSHPRRIERQLEVMRQHPDVAAVYCGYQLILGQRRVAPLAEEKDEARCGHDISRFVMPSHDPTGMYRMSLIGAMRYEPDLPIVEGYDYILRMGERYPMRVVGECLYDYRLHAESVTKRNPARRNQLVAEVLRRACVRRGLQFNVVFPAWTNGAAHGQRELDNNVAAHFMDSVCWQRRRGNRVGSLATGLLCARMHPIDFHYWKALVYAVLPQTAVQRIRRSS
jgi:glycosyltransferase involved in cell wall biosynthesis